MSARAVRRSAGPPVRPRPPVHLALRAVCLSACPPVTLLTLLALSTANAQTGTRLWRPEERVVISDFRHVTAVAATQRYVFAATRNGLGIYDHRARVWELPVTALDGYPAEPIQVALGDETDESVWLGTSIGLVHYQPAIRRFDRVPVSGGVIGLMFDAGSPFSGIYIRTRAGWEFLSRGGLMTQRAQSLPTRRIATTTVDEVLARTPAADAFRALALTDERMRSYRYTAAVIAPQTGHVYFGTNGLGVIRYEPLGARFERLPLGLLAAGVGALAVVPGGVWVGSDARAPRKGFTRVDESLREYLDDEGAPVTGFGMNAVRALTARGRQLWAGTDVGVIRFEPGARRPDRLDTGSGLPDAEVYSLAQSAAGVWVGTVLGLALVHDTGTVIRMEHGLLEPVLSVSASRDSAWVGTTSGLYFVTAKERRVTIPAEARLVPGLRGAIVSITRSADTVVVANVDQIFWRAPDGTWTAEPVIAGRIGPVYAVEGDSAGVWVGGARGFAFFRFATRSFHVFAASGDLPGAVRDLAVSGRYLWIATEAGLVRFERRVLYP